MLMAALVPKPVCWATPQCLPFEAFSHAVIKLLKPPAVLYNPTKKTVLKFWLLGFL